MTDGLTGLGLGLARNGTGVNDDQIGILGIHNSKAQAHKIGSDTVRLNRLTRQPRLTTEIWGASTRTP